MNRIAYPFILNYTQMIAVSVPVSSSNLKKMV